LRAFNPAGVLNTYLLLFLLRSLLDIGTMQTLPLRLIPGQDLRAALEAVLDEHGVSAAFVLQGIGSLSVAQVRLAGATRVTELRGDLEILSLAGSLSPDGAHLHIGLADAQGRMLGGHVATGCSVRTTVEVLVALLPGHQFAREPDAGSGFRELVVRTRPQQG
jgi:predicted DNA-binding protein with PD1-like motif